MDTPGTELYSKQRQATSRNRNELSESLEEFLKGQHSYNASLALKRWKSREQ